MEKITLRSRKLPSGNQSLYLEFYEKGSKRQYEALNLFLVPEKDENDRRVNEATMKQALKIKSERVLGINLPRRRRKKGKFLAVLSASGWMISSPTFRQTTAIQMRTANMCAVP